MKKYILALMVMFIPLCKPALHADLQTEDVQPRCTAEIIARYPQMFRYQCEKRGVTLAQLMSFASEWNYIVSDDTYWEYTEYWYFGRDYKPWMVSCLHAYYDGCKRVMNFICQDVRDSFSCIEDPSSYDITFRDEALSLINQIQQEGYLSKRYMKNKKRAEKLLQLALSNPNPENSGWVNAYSDALLIKLLLFRLNITEESIERGLYIDV